MAQAPLSRPRLFSTATPGAFQTGPQVDGTNTFSFQQFLTLASGALRATAATDTQVYGLSLDASHTSTDEPYTAPFGETHNLLRASQEETYIMNLSGATATSGSGGAQTSVTVGSSYSLAAPGSSATTNMQMINTASTAGAFQIVGLYSNTLYPDGDASTDTNGRVLVKVVGIQS